MTKECANDRFGDNVAGRRRRSLQTEQIGETDGRGEAGRTHITYKKSVTYLYV